MKRAISLFGLLMALAIPSGLLAQQAGYSQTNLVSNTADVATTTDPQLLNPWKISILPGRDFWIANNNGGTSTLYDELGNKDTSLVVTIPGRQVAMLVVMFCFAFSDDLVPTRKKSSVDPLDNAYLLDYPMPVETGTGVVCGDRLQHGQERVEALHG